MIPAVNNEILTSEILENDIPSNDFKMDLNDERINGTVSDIEEVKQSIYNTLNTERYKYVIHSWNFGVETEDLIGEPVDLVCSELRRRIEEALLQDDRISAVYDFEFDTKQRGSVLCTFKVDTTFGAVDAEKAVDI